jgi:eukaryotic-like serine/threonine-protein kinase
MRLGGSLSRRRSGGEPRTRRGGRKASSGPGLRLALLVLLLGGGIGYFYATQVAFPAEVAVEAELEGVPDLRGAPLDQAQAQLEARGFLLGRVDSIQHPRVEPGAIVGQTPFPDQLLPVGGSVDLTLSLGPERRPVPDVARLRADRALTVLRTTGFEVLVDSVEATLPAGRVLSTDPPAGREVTLPSAIRILVSLGPPRVLVPNLIGMREEEVRILLDSLGLVMEDPEVRSRFDFGSGEVSEQLPLPGEEAPVGSTVRVVIGGGRLDL